MKPVWSPSASGLLFATSLLALCCSALADDDVGPRKFVHPIHENTVLFEGKPVAESRHAAMLGLNAILGRTQNLTFGPLLPARDDREAEYWEMSVHDGSTGELRYLLLISATDGTVRFICGTESQCGTRADE